MQAKVLFIGVSPDNHQSLHVDREARAVERAIRESKFRELFVFEKQFAVRVSDLQALLLQFEPQIVHFAGHGTPSGEVLFENEAGEGSPSAIAAVGRLIAAAAPGVRCTVLNTCYSAEEITALADSTRCAVGMTGATEDKAAITFAEAFYRALGYGKTIREAVDQAVIALDVLGHAASSCAPFLAARSEADAAYQVVPAATQSPTTSSSSVTFNTTVTGGRVGKISNRSGG